MQLSRNRSVERAQVVVPILVSLLLCCIGTGVEWYSYSISFTTPYATSSYSLSMKLFQVCSPSVCRDYPIDSAKIQAAQAFAIMSCLALGLCSAASVQVARGKESFELMQIGSRALSILLVGITLVIASLWQVDPQVKIFVTPDVEDMSVVDDYKGTAGFGLFSTALALLILCTQTRVTMPSSETTVQRSNPMILRSDV